MKFYIKWLNLIIIFSLLMYSCSKAPELNLNSKDIQNKSNGISPILSGIVPDDQIFVDNNNSSIAKAFIYTLSNETEGNRVYSYKIKNNGTLEMIGISEFGGLGTGKPISSQGSLTINEKKEFLYAVNVASNSISVFKILSDGSLQLKQTIHSGGIKPVSLTVHKDLLYVLNTGSDFINGFHILNDGTLTPIEGSQKMLSGSGVAGAQVSFSPNGNFIIVTEKLSDIIGSYRVMENGLIREIVYSPSTGQTPYGFAFSGNHFLIVSNAWHAGPNASTASSYAFNGNGELKTFKSDVQNFQTAACWATTSQYGNYAYIANGDGHSISSYYVSEQGDLKLMESIAASTGKGPRDMIISKNNLFLYVITVGNGIEIFKRKPNGQLQSLEKTNGLPSSASGMITY